MTTLQRWLEQLADNPWLLASLALALGVGYLLGEVTARLVRAGLVALAGEQADRSFAGPLVRRPIRMVRAAVTLAAWALLAPLVLRWFGLDTSLGLAPDVLVAWVLSSGVRVLVIAAAAFVLVRVVSILSQRLEEQLAAGDDVEGLERAKRARTVAQLVRNGLDVAVMAIAILIALREVGVDIMPLLTGAGIVGLAIGFGAQTLVRDVISGFFIILEGHLRVGDVAVIDGTGGVVEAITLRTTVLRDLEGTVHVFPNGSFERVSNRSKDYSYALLNVGVAYKEDTDHVADILKRVGAELRNEPRFASEILEPLEVLGVDAFEDSQVTIKVRIKTVPLKQWEVARELRRRIKKTFDAEGIEIPFPHMSVYFGEASKPWQIARASNRAAAQ